MSRSPSVDDYPEHLNPFDDNYGGATSSSPQPSNSRQKYNTWGAARPHQVALSKTKPTFLQKPWAALNISPKGKIVRRLSILKTAVEKFTTKKTRLSHSSSYTEGPLGRSNSLHNEYSFRIISPKIKEKLRQQAFSRPVSSHDQADALPLPSESPNTPEINGRLDLSLKPEEELTSPSETPSPTSPELDKDISLLGARRKSRKKRPPPPPPPPNEEPKTNNLDISNERKTPEDSYSANSSITQELEKDALSDEDNSMTELDRHIIT